jgi:hypothetical protein
MPSQVFLRKLLALAAMLLIAVGIRSAAHAEVAIDLSGYDADCEVRVVQADEKLALDWPIDGNERGEVALNLSGNGALIERLATRRAGEEAKSILTAVQPRWFLTVGSRVIPPAKPLEKPWEVFFDNPHRRPHETHASLLAVERARVTGSGSRATVRVETLAAGPFTGAVELTCYAGSPLVRLDAVLETKQDRLAMFYDAGLMAEEPPWRELAWFDTSGKLQGVTTLTPALSQGERGQAASAQPLKVRHRAIAASNDAGAVACFPPPHQFQFPRDYSTNLGFVWHGSGYQGQEGHAGFGIRQNKDGGGNFVPWFNAPPNVPHRLGMFLLVTSGSAEDALRQTLRYTNNDRFPELPGYKTLTSHYHMAIAVTAMQERERGFHRTEPPDYVNMFKEMNVNIVHQGEFHGDGHPRDPGPLRLPEMEAMFGECRRWSDETLLILPGEEGNDFLGLKLEGKHPGHWMSLFPRPVYWTMTRAADQPFVEEHPKYGKVYHVGGRADKIRLLKEENGLVWSAHPRIKASSWTPDIFRHEDFFLAEFWLGGAWKAMPGDLSRVKQGERVLDLLDDMANWGHRKYVLGEVDVFKIDPTHELYAHMNVNYVKLDRLPKFDEGWQSVCDVLRGGRFFVTTGEVLIPKFTVGGAESGDVLKRGEEPAELVAELRWTFPLAFAEIVSGDGNQVYRERIDLSDTKEFGSHTLRHTPHLSGRHWVRFEVWDIAANGAFTQPVWAE